MTMLTIYCDDGGTDASSRTAVVGGCLGQVAQWDRFKVEWKAILKKYKISQMHRSHLEGFHGEFKRDRGWDEKRRRAFLQELHPIIKKRTKFFLGTAVIKADFENVLPKELQEFGLYAWCFHECIANVMAWCKLQHYSHPIDWVIELGTVGSGQVAKMLDFTLNHPRWSKEAHVGNVSFSTKECMPLQSADVVAYEIFKQVENQIIEKGTKHSVRLSARNLFSPQDLNYTKYWDETRLRDWLRKYSDKILPPDPLRRG